MRNVTLYKTLQEYCEAALVCLSNKIAENQDLPTTVKEEFEFGEDGEYSGMHPVRTGLRNKI